MSRRNRIKVAPVRNAFSHDVKSCSRIWLKAQDLFDKYPTVLMHQIYFICNGTVEPTKPIYVYKRCNRSWIYESWNLLRVRGYNKSREKWISFLNIVWWPECDVFAMSQIGRKCIAKRHRNHVAVMFHGDFDIKSHSCPDAMSQLGRSCISWRLSYMTSLVTTNRRWSANRLI